MGGSIAMISMGAGTRNWKRLDQSVNPRQANPTSPPQLVNIEFMHR